MADIIFPPRSPRVYSERPLATYSPRLRHTQTPLLPTISSLDVFLRSLTLSAHLRSAERPRSWVRRDKLAHWSLSCVHRTLRSPHTIHPAAQSPPTTGGTRWSSSRAVHLQVRLGQTHALLLWPPRKRLSHKQPPRATSPPAPSTSSPTSHKVLKTTTECWLAGRRKTLHKPWTWMSKGSARHTLRVSWGNQSRP